MPASEPALQPMPEPHIHASTETCPTCDQPIPNEKAIEIRARAEAQKRHIDEAANTRADRRIAAEKERIETAAAVTIRALREEKEQALEKASAEADSRVEAALAEGRKAVEADLRQQLAAAEKAKTEAAEQTQEALKRLQAAEEERDQQINTRVGEARDALEKANAEALAQVRSENDKEKRKLTEKLEALQRQLKKQRADELGEGAEVKLFDDLKARFPGDKIRRVAKGVSGADILHTVVHNGQDCGTIIYDSKNTGAWRTDYVTKLVRDQTAAKADHAVLSTLKFPANTSLAEFRDGVMIVNPALAVAIVAMIRRHLLAVHTLRLSKTERTEKMAALYDFITSERCTHLLQRIDSDSDALLDLQVAEKKAHDNHWRKQGTLLRSIQKTRADLDVEIDSIIGARDAGEDQP